MALLLRSFLTHCAARFRTLNPLTSTSQLVILASFINSSYRCGVYSVHELLDLSSPFSCRQLRSFNLAPRYNHSTNSSRPQQTVIMKLRSGYSTEWLSKINTIDLYGLNGWCFQVFLTCPLLINAQFPLEFALNWVRPGQEGDGSRDDYIPDDKSIQDWIDNPRPCLLRLGELSLYAEFKKWYKEVMWDDYTVLGGWDYSIQMYYAVTMPDAMQVVRATMKIRQQLSDEQLKRFLNEVYLPVMIERISLSDQYYSGGGNGPIIKQSGFVWWTIFTSWDKSCDHRLRRQ